jgi:hypothetical protein
MGGSPFLSPRKSRSGRSEMSTFLFLDFLRVFTQAGPIPNAQRGLTAEMLSTFQAGVTSSPQDATAVFLARHEVEPHSR